MLHHNLEWYRAISLMQYIVPEKRSSMARYRGGGGGGGRIHALNIWLDMNIILRRPYHPNKEVNSMTFPAREYGDYSTMVE